MSQPRPRSAPDRAAVLTKATLGAADRLGLAQHDLARVLGVSPASLSRLHGTRRIDPDSKEGELALLFLRVFRSLDVLVGGHEESARQWLSARVESLGGVPRQLVTSVAGLCAVVDYLDAMRGRA